MNKREVNIQTGEITLVAMTAEEIAELSLIHISEPTRRS